MRPKSKMSSRQIIQLQAGAMQIILDAREAYSLPNQVACAGVEFCLLSGRSSVQLRPGAPFARYACPKCAHLSKIIRAKLDVLIARFRSWWQPDDGEERYCWKCKQKTRWHPEKGCRECWWADQQL